jgi:hypothetical protein
LCRERSGIGTCGQYNQPHMPEELVTLWRYRDLPEALVARAKLDSDAVWCVLADDNVVRLDWFWSNAFGGVRLQVEDTDAEHALALLAEEIPAGFTAEETGETYQQPDCPKCHSRDTSFEPMYRGLAFLLLLMATLYVGLLVVPILLAVPGRIREGLWKCEDCNHEWKADYD